MLSSFRADILSSSSKRAPRAAHPLQANGRQDCHRSFSVFYFPLTATIMARRKTDRDAPRPGPRARLLEAHDVQDDGCVADVLVQYCGPGSLMCTSPVL